MVGGVSGGVTCSTCCVYAAAHVTGLDDEVDVPPRALADEGVQTNMPGSCSIVTIFGRDVPFPLSPWVLGRGDL